MAARMRAKVILQKVTRLANAETWEFVAVAKSGAYPPDGSDEDNTFAKWSPSATFTMTCTNPNLMGAFNPGEKYYVDFTPAE